LCLAGLCGGVCFDSELLKCRQMEALAELSRGIGAEDDDNDDSDVRACFAYFPAVFVCNFRSFDTSISQRRAMKMLDSAHLCSHPMPVTIPSCLMHACVHSSSARPSDAICRLLPHHGRTKLLQLIRDIYHRFHVLHCCAGMRMIASAHDSL
jgi:hypothetical protein